MDIKEKVNDWMAYSIAPRELQCALRPAMWGNGQLELMADLDRPCVGTIACFGFGPEGILYEKEQHLVPAVYSEATGRKYFLHMSSPAHEATVTFRPDRQTWHYAFDDLDVDVSLILVRQRPGYLFKVELRPHADAGGGRWRIYQQLRGYQGNLLMGMDAGSSLTSGMAWCRNRDRERSEAIGSNLDATSINLGEDYDYANDLMVEITADSDDNGRCIVYLARAFAVEIDASKDGLAGLLSSPETLEAEAETWWNDYLDSVPRLQAPDEDFARSFLWSWANFRMSRMELPIGIVPAGLVVVNNVRFTPRVAISGGDPVEIEAIQLLNDPQPARDTMLFLLRETRKHGLLSPGYIGGSEFSGGYACCFGWFCGLLYKYLLNTGDMGLLSEPIGDGLTVLQRLENALEAQLEFRDERSGLFWIDGEMKRFPGLYPGEVGGMGPNQESVTRYRGGRGSFFNDCNASVWGGLIVMAEIEELVGNSAQCTNYRQQADDLMDAVQTQLWDEEAGIFVDRCPQGKVTDYRGIGSFVTGLFANHVHRPGGMADASQAERLVDWCNDPEFVSEFGVLCLARSNPYFDPADYKGFNSGFGMHWCNQLAAGLYAHGCYDEAHRQLFKLFRRIGENVGLGPRYRGEGYHADTGEILPWRFPNYPCLLSAMSSVIEGVFGMRWTKDALTAHVNAPWPTARLSNLRVRQSLLDLELTGDGTLVASIDGREAARSSDAEVTLPWELFS
ncbi:MAG: hypothetical protein QGF67_08895 [Lentisphaeria bacterium]|jgi:hypothetical protein|nr:hypothetical protein [Lentisphaeria bacterium]MDP7741544.1 hypothetical protein [Lentisphaeria bacterium]